MKSRGYTPQPGGVGRCGDAAVIKRRGLDARLRLSPDLRLTSPNLKQQYQNKKEHLKVKRAPAIDDAVQYLIREFEGIIVEHLKFTN
jgi:hypothetical protein